MYADKANDLLFMQKNILLVSVILYASGRIVCLIFTGFRNYESIVVDDINVPKN